MAASLVGNAAPCSAISRRTSLMGLALLAAGCAPLRRTGERRADEWTGRLSLMVRSEPAQSFSAAFELRGTPAQGELQLTSPLGTTLAATRWAPGEAWLQSGQDRRRFDSMETLLEEVTGTALPLGALFDWLAGQATAVDGWVTDLSRHSEGRLAARRNAPAPLVDLRIVLDQ